MSRLVSAVEGSCTGGLCLYSALRELGEADSTPFVKLVLGEINFLAIFTRFLYWIKYSFAYVWPTTGRAGLSRLVVLWAVGCLCMSDDIDILCRHVSAVLSYLALIRPKILKNKITKYT